jgi:hypothetical protein
MSFFAAISVVTGGPRVISPDELLSAELPAGSATGTGIAFIDCATAFTSDFTGFALTVAELARGAGVPFLVGALGAGLSFVVLCFLAFGDEDASDKILPSLLDPLPPKLTESSLSSLIISFRKVEWP